MARPSKFWLRGTWRCRFFWWEWYDVHPWEINMEPKRLMVCRCFSFSKGVFSGSMLVFGGGYLRKLPWKSIKFGQMPPLKKRWQSNTLRDIFFWFRKRVKEMTGIIKGRVAEEMRDWFLIFPFVEIVASTRVKKRQEQNASNHPHN